MTRRDATQRDATQRDATPPLVDGGWVDGWLGGQGPLEEFLAKQKADALAAMAMGEEDGDEPAELVQVAPAATGLASLASALGFGGGGLAGGGGCRASAAPVPQKKSFFKRVRCAVTAVYHISPLVLVPEFPRS